MWDLCGGRASFPNQGFGGLQVTVSFYAEGGQPINQAGVFLTGIGEYEGFRNTAIPLQPFGPLEWDVLMWGQRWIQVCWVWGPFAPPNPGMMVGSAHPGISLDVDADRDGVVEKNNPNKVIQPLPLHRKSMGLQELELAKPQRGVLGKLDLGS